MPIMMGCWQVDGQVIDANDKGNGMGSWVIGSFALTISVTESNQHCSLLWFCWSQLLRNQEIYWKLNLIPLPLPIPKLSPFLNFLFFFFENIVTPSLDHCSGLLPCSYWNFILGVNLKVCPVAHCPRAVSWWQSWGCYFHSLASPK